MPLQILERKEGTLPYKQKVSDQLLSVLAGTVGKITQDNKDKQLRQAAAKLLNTTEVQVPMDITTQDLVELQKEKFKATLNPKETLDQKLDYETQLAQAKENAEVEGLKNLLRILPQGQEQGNMPIQGDLVPNANNASVGTPGGINLTFGDIIKGRLKQKYGIEVPQTQEEIQSGIQQKATEQAVVAAEKERQVNLGKVRRLNSIANIIETKWLETQPQKGGLGRLLGMASIPMSSLQMNRGQQTDYAYRTFVKGMRAQLARAMGDVGNLSEPEQKAAMDLVPKLDDSYEVGTKKLQTIRDFVKSIESGNVDIAKDILGKTSTTEEQSGNKVGKYTLIQE